MGLPSPLPLSPRHVMATPPRWPSQPPARSPAAPTYLQEAEGVAVELERPPCEVHSARHHAGLEHLAQDVDVVDAGPHRGHNLGACGEQERRQKDADWSGRAEKSQGGGDCDGWPIERRRLCYGARLCAMKGKPRKALPLQTTIRGIKHDKCWESHAPHGDRR